MKGIQEIIGDLLLQHNCVIVPGFGGFVAQQVSAKVDFDRGVMLPPSKALRASSLAGIRAVSSLAAIVETEVSYCESIFN